MVRIRLTKKLAATLNGIDVSALCVGDVVELPDAAARMMIAEGWAEPDTAPAGTPIHSSDAKSRDPVL